MERCYSDVIQLPTFKERYEYLRLGGIIGQDTFGANRYLNQKFYNSPEWKKVKRDIIIRDEGRDLAMEGYELHGTIYIHHINPITPEDLYSISSLVLNPENLICVSKATHEAIHFGDASLLPKLPIERTPNDMCPWKQVKQD